MRSNFLLSATLFHAVFLAACARLVAVEAARLRRGKGRAAGLAFGIGLLGSTMVVLALLLSLLAPPSGFTAMRLVAQALFGEGPLVALALAGLHLRARRMASATVLLASTAILLGVYVEAYHLEPRDLQVVRHEVDLRGGAPESGRLRIVQLSDIQTDRVGAHEERALGEALKQKPDLIVLTGDYVQSRLDDTRAQAGADLRALLRRLDFNARLGVFAVQGDTDRNWPGVLRDTPVRCLTSEAVRIALPGGRSLSLLGLTLNESRGDDASALRLVERAPTGDLRLVIGHRPDFVLALAGRTRVDLALAGHTHGGQIVVPGFGAPVTLSRLPRLYASGLHLYQGIPLHVSPGVGMERLTAPQVRFLCPPEVSVLDVRY
jgi:predicted MPP superfamily phosphohydrolase